MNVNVRVGSRRIGVAKERPAISIFAALFAAISSTYRITCANACTLIPCVFQSR